jgi:hypothetical protein
MRRQLRLAHKLEAQPRTYEAGIVVNGYSQTGSPTYVGLPLFFDPSSEYIDIGD